MLVSTRSTVPGTLARAAAWTLAARSPVSALSDLPLTVCGPWAAGVAEDDAVDDDVAAPAMAAPPAAAPRTAAAVTNLVRRVDIGLLTGEGGDCEAHGVPPSCGEDLSVAQTCLTSATLILVGV